MAKLVTINPEVARRNLSNLKRLDTPTLLELLDANTFQDKSVTPDPEFAKLVEHVQTKRKR